MIRKTTTPTGDPGIYAGISNEAYHAGPGISKSGLDKLARSPAHYHEAYLSLTSKKPVETPAMAMGTAVHTAILEPEDFHDRYHIAPKVDARTKDGKAAKEAAQAEAAAKGAILIDDATHATVSAMAASVRRHDTAPNILEAGHAELSVYWIDKDSGVLCRCRPDWLGLDVVLDVKTTEDASPRGFYFGSVKKYNYAMQAAFYLDGLKANGVEPHDFIFAAVEKSPPHVTALYSLQAADLADGRDQYKALLETYAECTATGHWPGYHIGIMPLGLARRMSLEDVLGDDDGVFE